MLLQKNEKVHVIHRQFFDKENGRSFIGFVEACDAGVIRIRGSVFNIDFPRATAARVPEEVTRFVTLVSGDYIVCPLPDSVDLAAITYQVIGREVRITDGSDWNLLVSGQTLH
ncbi:MAG: hypothetical protein IPL39_21880 [Opitutaceae bacterium]|nr:hypothetical protein [Opitutaceae bacterium]